MHWQLHAFESLGPAFVHGITILDVDDISHELDDIRHFAVMGGQHFADFFVSVIALSRKIADMENGAVFLSFSAGTGQKYPFPGPL